ncbi:hypothetical protein L1987_85974 [Smallanthus sonchifolius]|uniref:Uncharacterized protein n=1 Tax=Smallanthus sonchifolius TaxID=185202 RepID=A0ACB8XYS1_9ASTR|nr:hypothetical protein L1987_85974 [Smallanthus sonchifolius]
MYVLMGGYGNRFKAYFDLILDFHARKNIKMEMAKMGRIKKAYNERMGRLKTIVEEKEDELKVLLEDVKHKKHLLYDLMKKVFLRKSDTLSEIEGFKCEIEMLELSLMLETNKTNQQTWKYYTECELTLENLMINED